MCISEKGTDSHEKRMADPKQEREAIRGAGWQRKSRESE